jgi:hypothetical protein
LLAQRANNKMFPAVRGASSNSPEAWSAKRAKSFERAAGPNVGAVAPSAARPPRADGWAPANDELNTVGERSAGDTPIYGTRAYAQAVQAAQNAPPPMPARAAASGLPWWWPVGLPAPQPKPPPPMDRPPPEPESDWEQRFSTQYNRHYCALPLRVPSRRARHGSCSLA